MKTTALIAALMLVSSAVIAAPKAVKVIHNGSLMDVVEVAPQQIRIVYADPKPELWAIGVRPGTVLVEGTWVGPNDFQGTARVFSTLCGALPYRVHGVVLPDSSLELTGPAPIIDWGCRLVTLQYTANSFLRFSPPIGRVPQ